VFNINIETNNIDFLDRDYNIIYFGDVIEHLQYPINVLKKIKKHLNVNGSVIFSIPNMAHISVRLMLLRGRFEYGNTGLLDKTHLHYYDKEEIERIFYESGYRIEKLDWVSRDIPRELLERELKAMGLTGDSRFFKLAKCLEAGAYQYVGKAIPSSVKMTVSLRPKISPPIDMFERHLADIKKSYLEEINRHDKQEDVRSVKIEQLNKHINELTKRIEEYDRSLSWKITKPLRKVAKIIKKSGT
jgi:hypothetical protein